MTRGGYARQTGTGTENTSSVGTTQGLKLKLRGYGRQKRDKAGYGSQSHHQDGHARGGPRLGDVVDCYQAVIPCDYHTRDYSTD